MWERRKYVRKREIAALRAEGRQAFLDGKHVQNCPHKYMDRFQWVQGYTDARNEATNFDGDEDGTTPIHE